MPNPSTGSEELLAFAPTVVASGFDPVALVHAVFALDKVYFMFEDGAESMQVYDGAAVKEVSGVAPSALPTVTAVAPAGAGDTGQRWYTYTLYDPDADVETGPAANEDSISDDLYQGVALVAQDADIDIPNPASGSRFTKARVYRNLKPLTDMYLLDDITVTPGAGGNVTYSDDFTIDDDTLATHQRINISKRFYSEGLPPSSYCGCFFEGRMFIADPERRNRGMCSEANLLEDFPTEGADGASNEFFVEPTDQDPNPEIKAILPNNGQRYIYTRRGIYHLFGEAPPFGVRCVVAGVGADSTYSTKAIEGVGVVFCSHDKPYVHLGGSDVRPLGVNPKFPDRSPLGDLYSGTDAGRRKHSDSLVYPEISTIFLALADNGQAVNERIFRWCYAQNDWSTDLRAIMRLGLWALPSGRLVPVFADELGGINQMEVGDSEGVYGQDFSAAVTSSARRTVSFNAAKIMTATPKGTPIRILDATGGVVYRNRVVIATSPPVFTVLHPWTTLPVNTQTVEAGSIEFAWESGYFTLFPDRCQASIGDLACQLVKQAGGTFRMLAGTDQDTALDVVDAAVPLSIVQAYRSAKVGRGSQLKVRFENTSPGSPIAIPSWAVDLTKKSHRV